MNIFKKDITKLFVYIALSFLLGALLTPHLYNAGKSLAVYVAENDAAAPLEWLGKKAERAEYGRYFKRALVLMALVLLYPLILWMRRPSEKKEKKAFWLRINPRLSGGRDFLFGFIIAAGLFAVLGIVAVSKGYFIEKENARHLKTAIDAIPTALAVGVIEELVFRGLLLGLLLRTMRPFQAIVWLSAFFAIVHFIQPPKGIAVDDPTMILSGIYYLGNVFLVLAAPAKIIGVCVTLFGVGLITAYAAYKTGKLWLPIGLHAGWVVIHKVMTKTCYPNPDNDMLLVIGKNVTEGLLPLSVLAVTAGIVMIYIKKFYAEKALSI